MADDKRYYWIKLKQNFFDLDAIDWLQSQANGCEYIVLYQKLCLMAANKGGRLYLTIGEMLIPYDVDKISRDTKFKVDTVRVALELFKKLGLIYQQENGIISIPYVDEIVGSECESAERVRKHRTVKALQCNTDVTKSALQCNVEYRDRDIEYRDRDIDIEYIDRDNTRAREETKTKRFSPPTYEMIEAFCDEIQKPIDIEKFLNYYQSNGWKVGKAPMKSWEAAVRNWRKRDEENGTVYQPKRKPGKSVNTNLDDVTKEKSYTMSDWERSEMEFYNSI